MVRSRRSAPPDKDVLKVVLTDMLPELSEMVAKGVVAKLAQMLSRSLQKPVEVPASVALGGTLDNIDLPITHGPGNKLPDPLVVLPPCSLQRHVPQPVLPPTPGTIMCSADEVVLVQVTPSLSPPSDNFMAKGSGNPPHQQAMGMQEVRMSEGIFPGLTLSELELSPSLSSHLMPTVWQKPLARTPALI
ncbi:hypothetical protein JVT61DRAFT_10387 [Boletus reticuloceps]|uniref:Uncharacterized protein n=1 Tax=Boletus reticuloceps TaxID=495285 RepID=A0A8I3AC27_9AGAM|nr:hypothetical protein JVT61DRAFT_10387 [Boletus reticuloceps]